MNIELIIKVKMFTEMKDIFFMIDEVKRKYPSSQVRVEVIV